MLYDENTRYLMHNKYRSMHRIDFWSGYYSNKGQHKQIIKTAFHKLMVSQHFLALATATKCPQLNLTMKEIPASNKQFYMRFCVPEAKERRETEM